MGKRDKHITIRVNEQLYNTCLSRFLAIAGDKASFADLIELLLKQFANVGLSNCILTQQIKIDDIKGV